MASKLPKIASSNIKNQESTPFFAWIRDFFLGVKRLPITPPPGLPTEDGEVILSYQFSNIFFILVLLSTTYSISKYSIFSKR